MHVRVDDLQGKRRRQLCAPASGVSVDSNLEPCRAVAHSDSSRAPTVLDPTKQNKLAFAVPNQVAR